MKKETMYIVKLSAVGNPDHREPINMGVPTRTVEVKTLKAASEQCRKFIDTHDLGAGNWDGGLVTDQDGKSIAQISYNGRVWMQ